MAHTIKLTNYNSRLISQSNIEKTVFFIVTENPNLPLPLRSKYALLTRALNKSDFSDGFGAYLYFDDSKPVLVEGTNSFVLTDDFSYLTNDDVIRFTSNLNLRVIYRRNVSPNYFMVTEQCNSFCLMCSQPPKKVNDSHLIREYIEAIPLLHNETHEIGISGGEPTILGEQFIELLNKLNSYLPRTALHVLSNGKAFTDIEFISNISKTKHSDLMFGIPLYSHIDYRHDYIVQDKGAFNKTVEGILNLKQFSQKVELRCVIQKPNSNDLVGLSNYIARNLQFVDQVAFMGLEVTGFAKSNFDELWIEPSEYMANLEEAVWILRKSHVKVKIFNHQLCLLPESLWQFSVQSISDWKNSYIDECNKCNKKSFCGGFFSTSDGKIPSGITAF
jgi:His-Xaa-Ser system radical SAM maturase HxsC